MIRCVSSLTKRADYAVRAVLALARATPGERRSVREIAEDQRIPAGPRRAMAADLVRPA
jgi:DNA-binding IscR family transcriptional regulator